MKCLKNAELKNNVANICEFPIYDIFLYKTYEMIESKINYYYNPVRS